MVWEGKNRLFESGFLENDIFMSNRPSSDHIYMPVYIANIAGPFQEANMQGENISQLNGKA